MIWGLLGRKSNQFWAGFFESAFSCLCSVLGCFVKRCLLSCLFVLLNWFLDHRKFSLFDLFQVKYPTYFFDKKLWRPVEECCCLALVASFLLAYWQFWQVNLYGLGGHCDLCNVLFHHRLNTLNKRILIYRYSQVLYRRSWSFRLRDRFLYII